MSQNSIEVAIASTIPGAAEIIDALNGDSAGNGQHEMTTQEMGVLAGTNQAMAQQNAETMYQLQETLGQQQADINASLEASGAGLPGLPGMDMAHAPHADGTLAGLNSGHVFGAEDHGYDAYGMDG